MNAAKRILNVRFITCIERRGKNMELQEIYKKIKEKERNKSCFLATVLDREHRGEKLLLMDKEIQGKTGASDFLSRHREELWKSETTRMLCLEESRVFLERIGSLPTLAVCGGGYVACAVIRMGKSLGFRIVALDDRPKFADAVRRAGADEVLCEAFEEGLKKISGSENTYFVIATRGHRYDVECLEAIVRKPHAYIGVLGSRRRAVLLKKMLLEQGFSEDAETLHVPIGLSIGAETPEEIAVSILAELIQAKNKAGSTGAYEEELLELLSGEKEAQKKKVLAVIVSRKGSAPREIGTHMLILEDGRTVGTIGGGCMEGAVIQQALRLLHSETERGRVIAVDMTGREPEESGMACGGSIEVFLELQV